MSTLIVGHDFAALPALLAQAGMTDLIPPFADEQPAGAAPQLTDRAFAGDSTAVDERQEAATIHTPELGVDNGCPSGVADEGAEMARLQAELTTAAGMLAELASRDAHEREAALKDLERYDAVTAALEAAQRAAQRAARLRSDAERLAQAAFSEDVRKEAGRTASLAQRAEAQAEQWVRTHQARAEELAMEPGIRRALDERRRLEESQRAAAEVEAWAQRRDDAVSTARMAIAAGWFAEARAALAAVAGENEGDEEIEALLGEIAAGAAGARVVAAEAAVYAVRHELRHDPAAAVARLESLDVEGLPYALSCHVFNAWVRACLRWCGAQGIERPLLLAHRQGRGAVLVPRSASRRHVVFSALGMGEPWEAGRAVDDALVARAEPLRRFYGARESSEPRELRAVHR